MATDCLAIQEILTEHRGETDRLDGVNRHHLEVCPACREVAAAERTLGLIFADALPPADGFGPGERRVVLRYGRGLA